MKRWFSGLLISLGMIGSVFPGYVLAQSEHRMSSPLPHTDTPLSWGDVQALPAPMPGKRLTYGDAPEQFGYLRVPDGPGPHPVVVLIHGGCWLNAFDLEYFEHWAATLVEQGFATWNIEYRRLGDAGGGWPNTFLDVGRAIDQLRALAETYSLNTNDVRAMGHSAGGHLALWAATRRENASDAALKTSDPLALNQVIGLAAIGDLSEYRIGPPNSCHSSVDQLMGGDPKRFPDRYTEGSPAARLPLGVLSHLLQGDADPIVAPESVRRFVTNAQASGDPSNYIELPGAGHFDLGVPTAASLAAVLRALSENR